MNMMYFVLLSVMGCLVTVKADDICGPGGILNECASECDVVPTCAIPSDPRKVLQSVRACTGVCLKRCSCYKGYVLHEEKCVKREDCPKTDENICGPGGILNECASRCDLVPTCAIPDPQKILQRSPILCTYECLKRCSCHEGYVLHEEKCIKLEDCPKIDDDICGPGGTLNECASGCELVPTCAIPDPQKILQPSAILCTDDKCVKRCSCHEGYVLHEEKCIKLEDCPKMDECGPGGHINECASRCALVPTCEDPFPEWPTQDKLLACTKECVRRCSCNKGYVLHKGRCLPLQSCPGFCPKQSERLIG